MTRRTRKSGVSTVPVRPAQARIDFWRSSPNYTPYRLLAEGPTSPSAWDDSSTIPFVEVDSGVDWIAGWNLASWPDDSVYGSPERGREIAESTHRAYGLSSLPDYTFTYSGVGSKQTVGQSTSFVLAADSFSELMKTAPSAWVDGDEVDTALSELVSEVDSTLPAFSPLGSIPVVDRTSDKNIAWTAREYISPYGFYDEELLVDPSGVQLVGGKNSDGGFESFGFASSSVCTNHIRINLADTIRHTNLPVRARRGAGSDYYDWLPASARHVWMCRLPYMTFPAVSNDPTAPETTFDNDFAAPRVANRELSVGTPLEQAASFHAFESFSDRLRERKRAPTTIDDISDSESNTRPSFVRTSPWTQPLAPFSQTQSNLNTSALVSGGLWLGEFPLPGSPTPTAAGDNFVISRQDTDNIRGLFAGDEFAVEIGFTAVLGDPDVSYGDFFGSGGFRSRPFRSGYYVERFILSTSVEGGMQGIAGAKDGEVRPVNGFAVSVVSVPNFPVGSVQSTGLREIAVVANLYLVQNGVTRVVRAFRFVPHESASSNVSFRVVVSRKGGEFGITLQAYGVNEYPDSSEFAFSHLAGPNFPILSGQIASILSGQRFDTANAEMPEFVVDDDVLVIPSVASSRVFHDFSSEDIWTRSDGTTRLVSLEEYSAIFRSPTWDSQPYNYDGTDNQRLGFGLCVGGIALHDSVITDVNNINLPARLHGGLNWSSWLGVGARNSFTDIRRFGVTGADYYARLGVNDPSVSSLYEQETQVYPFSWAQIANPRGYRSVPNPGTFPWSSSIIHNRTMGDGVCLGQWKSGNSWNRQRGTNLQASRGGVTVRPWGLVVNRLVDTAEDALGRINSPRHLRSQTSGVSTKPLFSTWGTRFESKAGERCDYLSSGDLDPSNALFGAYDPIVTNGPSPKNYSIGVWLTVYDSEIEVSSTEKSFNIWSYGPVASLEIVSSNGKVRLRATLKNANASQPTLYTDDVHEVNLTQKMMGVPLYVSFGVIEFATLQYIFNAASPAPPTYKGGNNLSYLIVDSPEDVDITERGMIPSEDDTGTFRAAFSANNPPSVVPEPPNKKIQMGQDQVGLACDYVVGGVEVNKWAFNEVLTRATIAAGGNFHFYESEIFFDPEKSSSPPRLPVLREYVFSRCNSLWSYTGPARILPDHYGITSIDGVGADVFTEGKLNLQGGIQDDESSTNFNVTAFPSLFLSSKRLGYADARVAAYDLVRTKDRPTLYEVLDRQVAHAPFVGPGSLVDDPELPYYPLAVSPNEPRPRYQAEESAQLMRRLWYGRDITNPIVPYPELDINVDAGGLAGLRTYPIYTPALRHNQGQVLGINSIEEERTAVAASLEGVVDVNGFADLQGLLGTNDSSQVFRPCSLIGESSQRYENANRYGEIEFQRVRNESFPYVSSDGSNAYLVSLPMYRAPGTPTKTSAPPNESFEVVRVGFWEFDLVATDTFSVTPTPLFPTYSTRWRGDELDAIPESGETNVLGNLCFERSVCSWGFSETETRVPAYRIDTEDLGLVQGIGEPNPDFLERGVWKRQKGGRRMLRKQRVGGPPTAFSGKGRASWARAVYATTLEVGESGYYVDTLPPNPLEVIEKTQSQDQAYRVLDAIPDKTDTPKRTSRHWKRKRGQRVIAEESTGSPTPIVAAADGLNPFPSVASSAFQAALFGSPRWTDYTKALEREFARTLQASTFTAGEFDTRGLQERRRMLWIELTGSQFFPTWLEWARPEGGWGERGSFDAMLPYHAYPFAPLPDVGRVVSPRFARNVEAPVGPRAEYDPARVFEREIFGGTRNSTRLLLMDRFSTFDDRFPVASLGYNYRFVRSIAGRVGAGLNKHPVSTILRHPVTTLSHLGDLPNSYIQMFEQPPVGDPTSVFSIVEGPSVSEDSGQTSTWNLSGTFTPSVVSGEEFDIVPREGEFFAAARYGVWVTYKQPTTPLPSPSELYVTDESEPYTRTRVSADPVLMYAGSQVVLAEVPIFYRYAGALGVNGPIEVVAFEDGDTENGSEVVLNDPATGVPASTFDLETGTFSAPFQMHRSTTYQPQGNLQVGGTFTVDGEVVIEGEVVLGAGDVRPYDSLVVGNYWLTSPSIEQVRAGIYSPIVSDLILAQSNEAIVLWVEGILGEPEPYTHTSVYLLEGLLDDLSVDGTVTPLSLVNVLNRYTANDSSGRPVGGYLRNTLACNRVANSLLKLWYGTGDNIVRSDYLHWWKDANSFMVDVGTNTPQVQSLSSMDTEFQRQALNDYTSVVSEGDPYVPPNAGGNVSVWQFPRSMERYATSVRPFGPDASVSRYDNKQFWTRDIRLQDQARAQEVWSARHSYSHEFLQDVTIQPRGWRYGLSNVVATSSRWAINPRHWGHLSDIQRACPESARLRSGVVDACIKVQIVPIDGNIQSRNLDTNYRSFQPFIDATDVADVESLAYTRVNENEIDSIGVVAVRAKNALDFLLDVVRSSSDTAANPRAALASALRSSREYRSRLRALGLPETEGVFSGALQASLEALDASLAALEAIKARLPAVGDVQTFEGTKRSIDGVELVLRLCRGSSDRVVPASPSFPEPITYEQAIEYIRTNPVR